MVGAVVGDVIGSSYEFNNCLSKKFDLFTQDTRFTDDTVMTCAVALALIVGKRMYGNIDDITPKLISNMMREVGVHYPRCGYGGRFYQWVLYNEPEGPYYSFGNGSAMRTAPIGFVADTLEQCEDLAERFASVSHNHPEGIKGAVATSVCIFLARKGYSKEYIKDYVEKKYGYDLNMTCSEIRMSNIINGTTSVHKEICQISVPQAIRCFLESTNFEDCMRNCVATGGDSDTVGAIAGGIAQAYYGVPKKLKKETLKYLDKFLKAVVEDFEEEYKDNINERRK